MLSSKEIFAKQKGIALSEIKFDDFACWCCNETFDKWIKDKPHGKNKKCYGVVLLLEDEVNGYISFDKDDFTTANISEFLEMTGLFPTLPSPLDVDDEIKSLDPEYWMKAYECYCLANKVVEHMEYYKIKNGQAHFSCINVGCPGLPRKFINGTITWA